MEEGRRVFGWCGHGGAWCLECVLYIVWLWWLGINTGHDRSIPTWRPRREPTVGCRVEVQVQAFQHQHRLPPQTYKRLQYCLFILFDRSKHVRYLLINIWPEGGRSLSSRKELLSSVLADAIIIALNWIDEKFFVLQVFREFWLTKDAISKLCNSRHFMKILEINTVPAIPENLPGNLWRIIIASSSGINNLRERSSPLGIKLTSNQAVSIVVQ